jgi:uncharacterized protein VirK/YbjX
VQQHLDLPNFSQDTNGMFWASLWKLARQRYYWSSNRVFRIAWTFTKHIPTQIRVMRVLSEPAYKKLMAVNPRFSLKWMGLDYLARGLTVSQQAECFIHHYRRLPGLFSQKLLTEILMGDFLLEEIHRDHHQFAIRLALSRPWDDEGELSLNFEVDGKFVFVLSFTVVPGRVVQSPSEEVILITRVQGVKGRYGEIQLATKALYDVAPPALLLAALCGVACAFGINAMAGISASMKSEFHTYAEEIDHLKGAYDDFFTELGAKKGTASFYLSPLPPQEKPMSEIKRGHKTRTRVKRAFKQEITRRVHRLLL